MLPECTTFESKASEQQLKFVRETKLCQNCFSSTHYASGCKNPNDYKFQTCRIRLKHKESLHEALWTAINAGQRRDNDARITTTPSSGPGGSSVDAPNRFTGITRMSNTTGAWFESKALPIVPVRVKARGTNKVIEAYALLDSGSTCKWCTEKLVKNLGAEGPTVQVSLTTIEKENSPTFSSRVSIEIMDLEENVMIELPDVLSKEKLNISQSGISIQADVDRWPHLKGIELPDRIVGDVELLIGQDVLSALEPVEVRSSQNHGPYTTRTKFGWTLNGPLGRNGAKGQYVNFARTDELLNRQFERYMNLEFNDSISEDKVAMSRYDKWSLSNHEKSVRLVDGHYEIAIPWKESPPDLPNNKPLAEHRLRHLKKKLIKETELFERYSAFMDDLFKKGYARKVPVRDLDRDDGEVWYLPHHSVVHPQKPDKVRVVFDCTAKYRGTSLNDRILRGPDLTNKLVGVLLRFREEVVALMADVEAMFHQVRVCADDIDVLRFLWFPNNDLSREPEEHQMLIQLFGGVWSPSCANFALLKTAEDNSDRFGIKTTQTIKQNFYVDDCLKLVKTDEEAIRLSRELRELLAGGGFNLTKWISNSRKVLETIPVAERAKEVKDLNLGKDDLPIERGLGVFWNIESDQFMFKIKIKDKPLTRRGLLSVVSSVYDPLGFVCPFILSAKAILQDLCRKDLGWDDAIPDEYVIRWRQWLEELPKLGQFSINRCLTPPGFGDVVSRQLHHFADASNLGYGAVTYLRLADSSGIIGCSFVMGKSRVAPIKQMTIPRLKLAAATVAVRLDKMIREELDMPLNESVFWTDSTAVLQYIENHDRRFHTFVANRLSIIHDGSSPAQWRHVDTKRNPADDASRGQSAEALLTNSRWMEGPAFLWQSEEAWPERPAALRQIPDDDPEVKLEARVHAAVLVEGEETIDRMFRRYSSWNKLRKATSWILRYRSWLLSKVQQSSDQSANVAPIRTGQITVDEVEFAEQEILKYVQRRSFEEELKSMGAGEFSAKDESTKKGFVKKSSPICSLDPVVVGGLLRKGGRLRRASVEFDARHQIILPKNHQVVTLIVRHYGHSGQEYVLGLLRERFWIVKARVAVRRVLRGCFDCKRRKRPLGEQKMADLPADRVTLDKPPFSFVGVDCFGPFLVKRGRSLVKRYGSSLPAW